MFGHAFGPCAKYSPTALPNSMSLTLAQIMELRQLAKHWASGAAGRETSQASGQVRPWHLKRGSRI